MIELYGRMVCQSLQEVVDPKHTAIIVVDMQNEMGGGTRTITGALKTLLDAGRRAGVRVVYIVYTNDPDHASSSTNWIYAKAVMGRGAARRGGSERAGDLLRGHAGPAGPAGDFSGARRYYGSQVPSRRLCGNEPGHDAPGDGSSDRGGDGRGHVPLRPRYRRGCARPQLLHGGGRGLRRGRVTGDARAGLGHLSGQVRLPIVGRLGHHVGASRRKGDGLRPGVSQGR